MNSLTPYQVRVLEHAANSTANVCLLCCMEGLPRDGKEMEDRLNQELVAHAQLVSFGLATEEKKIPWRMKKAIREDYGIRKVYFIRLTRETLVMFKRTNDYEGEGKRRSLAEPV